MGYAYRVLLHATIYHSVTSLTIITIAWKLHFISESVMYSTNRNCYLVNIDKTVTI